MPRVMRFPWDDLQARRRMSFFIPTIMGSAYVAHAKRLREMGRIDFRVTCRRRWEKGIHGTRVYREDAKNIPPDGRSRNRWHGMNRVGTTT